MSCNNVMCLGQEPCVVALASAEILHREVLLLLDLGSAPTEECLRFRENLDAASAAWVWGAGVG